MVAIFLIVCLFFILLGIGILKNWKVSNPEQNTFSILIACRNEEKNLPRLFDHLKRINYPSDKFEVIIVDDASSDNSAQLITDFTDEKENFHSILLKEKSNEYKGKKAALKAAAENAKFDFLLFTDADCFPEPEWISSYNKYISEKTGFVIGSYKEINVSRFRKFCNQISSAIYASTTGLRFPFSAAGGNMAVRKKTFQQVGGYQKIKHNLAGDDKQLLTLIKKTGCEIRYNPEILVSTTGDHSNSHHKNRRKYGKFSMSSAYYKSISILLFLFFVYLPINIITEKKMDQFYYLFCRSSFFLDIQFDST